jgi:HrpA-like RNA helicase
LLYLGGGKEVYVAKSITEEKVELPIQKHIPYIISLLADNDVVIVRSPTGSGKSTQLPKALIQAGYQQVVHMLPTRVAVSLLYNHTAYSNLETTGATSGVKTGRFDERRIDDKILICTDGVALAKALQERYFDKYSSANSKDVFILDEAHLCNERMDTWLALYREARLKGQAPKLLILSATVDPEPLIRFLNEGAPTAVKPNIPVVDVDGRPYQRTEITPEQGRDISSIVVDLIQEDKGGVIVFLPHRGEIKKLNTSITDLFRRRHIKDFEIKELHGKLSKREQDEIAKNVTPRTVILSTNVAETSVTIEKLRSVVISGIELVSEIIGDETRLVARPLSQSSNEQQRGRVGRVEEGFVVDLSESEVKRSSHYWPMQHVHLDGIVLRLIVADKDPLSMKFPHQPPEGRLLETIQRLQRLGFIDRENKATELGRFASGLPLDPRDSLIISKALTLAKEDRAAPLVNAAITIAAIVNTGELQTPGTEADLVELARDEHRSMLRRSDKIAWFYAVDRILNEIDPGVRRELIAEFDIREAALEEIEIVTQELRECLGCTFKPLHDGQIFNLLRSEELLKVVSANWSDSVFKLCGKNTRGEGLYARVDLPQEPHRRLSQDSALPWLEGRTGQYPRFVTGEPFSLAPEVDCSENRVNRLISQASIVTQEWIHNNAALVRTDMEQRAKSARNNRRGRVRRR